MAQFSIAIDNRMLPGLLKDRYGIQMDEKIIRAEVKGKEINVFGKGRRNGKKVLIVGEARLRLDEKEEKRDAIKELGNKVKIIEEEKEYKEYEIVRLLLTHFATRGFIEKSEKEGIIVVQSFEW
ncbi:MAG: hypothetical protein AB1567_09415 [bacterium]